MAGRRARWRLEREALRALSTAGGAERVQAVQEWRDRRRLPRWVCVADGDNDMPVDLDNVLSVETFVELVKNREETTLVEMYPGADELCARGPEGRFVHELIVPFIRKHQPDSTRDEQPLSSFILHPSSFKDRRFPPGSSWLYAKLYAGPGTVDRVLCEVVLPLVRQALQSGVVDRWFFIRYGDPHWHLRLRLHGDPERLHREVLPTLEAAVAPLLADGHIWRMQLDTYEREVERYGGPIGVQLAEQVFQIDSEAVLDLVSLLQEDAREDIRWRLALCGIHRLVLDLGLDLATRQAVLSRVRQEFAREFHVDAAFQHQIGARYRQERKGLEGLLDPAGHTDGPLSAGLAILDARSKRLAPVVADLKASERAAALSASLADLAPSYIHMHVNRLLRSAQRAHELVLYDFLARCYESEMARLRCRLPSPTSISHGATALVESRRHTPGL